MVVQNLKNPILKVYLLSLGCAKNLVDSEMMVGLLKLHDFAVIDDPSEAEIIIVNTCGFIQAAKEEAIDNILALAQYKQAGKCQLLVATGCMVEKYRAEMAAAMPEIDGFLGVQEYDKIVELLENKGYHGKQQEYCKDPYLIRELSAPSHTAYLKIAEGCNNCCAYCMIPKIRGRFKSRPMELVLEEAQTLVEQGVQEVVVVAQDTTNYGSDLYGQLKLAALVEQLAQLPFRWIRLLYCYPDKITDELLAVMAKYDNVCHYLDIPLQHGDDKVLQLMNRSGTVAEILQMLERVRTYLPDIALRTTLMVGFPGETHRSFQNLLAFAQKAKFDWTGVFEYCLEEETASALLPQQVGEKTKHKRFSELMEELATISAATKERWVGQTLDVLVEGQEGQYNFGRSQYQAPDVDGFIYFAGESCKPGEFVKVKITSSDTYDLMGERI